MPDSREVTIGQNADGSVIITGDNNSVVVQRVQSATQITRSAAALAFQSRIRAFLDEYLLAETGPVPFGGRDREIGLLDAWLEDSRAPPRCLVSGPAGRGKSALLVNWIERLQLTGTLAGIRSADRSNWQFVFVPISIWFGTNSQSIFYQALAERLARLAGQVLEQPAADATLFYADKARDVLNDLARSGQRILVVLDGLDEALRGEFDETIFPRVLPPTVRLLVSARWQVGDCDSSGWLRRLSWDADFKCATIDLERLSTSAIRQAFAAMGAPLDLVAADGALVARLAELTEGEPLLLRFYALDLWRMGDAVTRITRADLDLLRPGFGAYFDRWLKSQERAWRDAGEQVDRRDVDAVLMILAFAHGPLQGVDLLALVQMFPGTTRALLSSQLLDPLRRFVIGDGSRERGYVLSHPKIGEYFQAERYRDAKTLVNGAFADWGREIVVQTNREPEKADNVTPYLLHFHRRHLEIAGATVDNFLALVENGWRQAWEHYEGGQKGFAGDVRAAWNVAKVNGPLGNLDKQLRCILTLSSILSLGQNIPRELIVAAARNSVLSIRQAIDLAGLLPDQVEYVLVLGALAVSLEQSTVEQQDLLTEALAAAKAIHDSYGRARALSGLQPYLAGEQLIDAMDDALAAARSVADEQSRATLLTELAAHLTKERRGTALHEALSAAKIIDDEMFRLDALVGLAPHLAASELRPVIDMVFGAVDAYDRACALAKLAGHLSDDQLKAAMDAAKAVGALSYFAAYLSPEQIAEELTTVNMLSEHFRAGAFGSLAPYLSAEQLQGACAAASAITDEHARAEALISLSPYLPVEKRGPLIANALRAAKAVDLGFYRADTLAKLASFLSVEQLGDALLAAKTISAPDSRAEALKGLADHLSVHQLGDALRVAMFISDHDERVGILVELSAFLEDDQRSKLLREAVRTARAITNEKARAKALQNLAQHISNEQRAEALAAALTIKDWSTRASALFELTDHLGNSERSAILTEALADADPLNPSFALALQVKEMGSRLPAEERAAVATVALAIVETISDEYQRAHAVARLFGGTDGVGAEKGLAIANAISDGRARALALNGLSPHLTCQQLGHALEAAKMLEPDDARAASLVALAGHLSDEQLEEALSIAKTLSDLYRARMLSGFASHLSHEQIREALEIAQGIQYEPARADALEGLAVYLPAELHANALLASITIDHEYSRGRALRALAPQLSVEQFREALSAAFAIRDESVRIVVLGSLAGRMTRDQLGTVLDSAKVTSIADNRAVLLSELVKYLPTPRQDEALQEMLNISDQLTRPQLLRGLRPFVAIVARICESRCLLNLRNSVQDTAVWYA
jgi:hypothetical protein